jgi:hypothetical protein
VILPTHINGSMGLEHKHLQRDITQAKDSIIITRMHARLATWEMGLQHQGGKASAAQLLSMAGPGATDRHTQCPFANYTKLASPLVPIVIRAELYLTQPGLAFEAGSKCNACGAKTTEAHAWPPRDVLQGEQRVCQQGRSALSALGRIHGYR